MVETRWDQLSDDLEVCKHGERIILDSENWYETVTLTNAESLALMEWLMRHVTVPSALVGVTPLNWTDGVTVTDTITCESKEPTE